MTTRKPWVGGNWKCNGTAESIEQLSVSLNKANWDTSKVDVVICPSTVYLGLTRTKLKSEYLLSLQNISRTSNGAFTGEISVDMMKDLSLKWTLVGHSERRQYFGETDEIVGDKVEICQKNNISVGLCIGEVLEERESGKTKDVLFKQLQAVLPRVTDWSLVVIAYEPVWAIGTGKTATPDQAQEVHKWIRDFISEKVSAEVASSVRIVYGGSVTPDNCKTLICNPDVDGFLVGGASLKPGYADIIDCTK
eukprot:GHVR01191533.1.p1 GENE.GHVR01191533.1~~GHVR01191533.1.p1  ORF type:complete len:250 (+),score=61.71 GHVR01191533.1:73-822(+)